MENDLIDHNDYNRIATAIEYIRSNIKKQPTLEQIAFQVNLTPFHFNRLFRKWAGISPKRYLEEITINHARTLLPSKSVLDASLDLGLTGPSRLHDHFVILEALSPGEFKEQGKGIEVQTGFAPSPFGEVLIVSTKRGIHGIAFIKDEISRKDELERFKKSLKNAHFVENNSHALRIVERIFHSNYLFPKNNQSHMPDLNEALSHIYLSVRGTNFQIQVWRALLNIPFGHTVSYQQIAHSIGNPTAVRAVAGAVAANPVHFIIPCHRVIRSDGNLGGYRGGEIRKEILLRYEQYQWENS